MHSLTGLVPLGAAVFVELWIHAAALAGPEAYAQRLSRATGAAWLAVVVLAALLYHGAYGIVLALRPRLNVARYPHGRGWMSVLQRWTGLLLVVFIAYHVATFWWPVWSGALAPADAHGHWIRRLSATQAGVPWLALGYAFGLAACAYHLGYGGFSVALRWGWLVTARHRRQSGPAFALLAGAIFAVGFSMILYLATGTRLVEGAADREGGRCLPESP